MLFVKLSVDSPILLLSPIMGHNEAMTEVQSVGRGQVYLYTLAD